MSKTMISFLMIVMMASGCGFKAPVATEQHHDQNVVVPASSQEFSLWQSPFAHSLRGSTVFWADDASAEDMTAVVTASRNIREAKGTTVQWSVEGLRPLQDELTGVTAQMAAVETVENERLIAVRRELSSNWVERRLSRARDEGVISQSELDEAMTVFSRYCEAKIWEFLANRAGVDRFTHPRWSQRPTPSQICEGVYQKLGFFNEDSTTCQSGQQNFMSCMLNEGLLKTSFFAGRYENKITGQSRSKAEILSSWMENGTWSFLLQTSSPERTKISTSLLKQSQPKPALFCRDFNSPTENLHDHCGIFVPDAGEPTDLLTSALDKMSPRFLVTQMEDLSLSIAVGNGGIAVAEKALLIPAARVDESKRALMKELREVISAFARRDSLAASVSDLLFNRVEASAGIGAVKGAELRLAVPAVAEIMRAGAGDEQVKLMELRESQAGLRTRIQDAKTKLASLDLAWTEALQVGAAAATKDGVSQAFAPKTELSLDFDGKKLLVHWAITDKGEPIFSGCAGDRCDSFASYAEVAYDETDDTIEFDANAEQLKAALVDIEGQAASNAARTDGFSLVNTAQLDGADVHVVIQLGRVSGEMIAGGTVVIFPKFGQEIRASMSLMKY
jgi:hypothetical protein